MTGLLLFAFAALADTPISDCNNPTAWEGEVEQDTAVARVDGVALRWTYGKAQLITLHDVPQDWTAHNAIAFWMHSEKPRKYRPWVVVTGAAAGEREEPPWAIVRLHVNFSGWHRFVIPFEEFELRAGAARPDWHRIASLSFDCRTPQWQLGLGDPATVLHIDDIRLITVWRPGIGEGPRMTDDEFFAALDLNRPELAPVRGALAAGNRDTAKQAVAAHLRSRRHPRWFDMWWERPEPNPGHNTTKADELLAGRFRMGQVLYEPKGRIDWTFNPEVYRTGPKKTQEYNAGLNRFYHIKHLHDAYWHTGRAEYAAEIVREMVNWVEDCPVLLCQFGKSPYSPPWQSLNTAARIIHYWLDCIFRTLDHPAWTDDALVKLLKSLHEHGEHLLRCHSTGTNWLTSEARSMVCLGMLFPEFRRAATWRDKGIELLYHQLEHEVYPDGAQFELAIGYHGSAMRNFSAVPLLAALNEDLDALPDEYVGRLEKMVGYLLAEMMPNGQVPGRNDSYERKMGEHFEQALKLFPGRADIRWAATEGAQGNPPSPRSVACRYAGHYIMRTGWDAAEDLYLLFDAGPFGAGHQHEDKLGFTMYGYGRILVNEGGVHQYNDSPQRQYVLSTRAHNTIRVDGLDQRSYHVLDSHALPYPFEPLDNTWVSDDAHDFVAARYEHGYGTRGSRDLKVGATHTRCILFVKPRYWVIMDTVTPDDDAEHSYESLFHLDAEQAVADGVRVETSGSTANVAIIAVPQPGMSVSASVVRGQTDPELQGWRQRSFNQLQPIPTAVFRWTARGRTQLVTVLVPIRPGASCPIRSVSRIPVVDSEGQAVFAAAIEIGFMGGTRHRCAIAAPGVGRCTFGEHALSTCCAVVKLDAEGRVLTTWEPPIPDQPQP